MIEEGRALGGEARPSVWNRPKSIAKNLQIW